MEENKESFENETDIIEQAMSVYDDTPALPSIYVKRPSRNLAGEVLALVASANAQVPLDRQVGRYEALTVLQRSLEKTLPNVANSEHRAIVAIREVSDFINVAINGSKPKVSQEHTDLLPSGNPMSTRTNPYSSEELTEFKAEWVAADPRISEEFRPLVASAYKTKSDSVEREYALAQLEVTSPVDVPRDVVLGLIVEDHE